MTIGKLIQALEKLPPTWKVTMDSVANIWMVDDRNRTVAQLDIFTGEIDHLEIDSDS